jgi:hypothetical protein
MHNVLCRSVTIEARFTASSRSSGSHIGIRSISTGPVTADSRGALWKALYVQDGYTENLFSWFCFLSTVKCVDVRDHVQNKNIPKFGLALPFPQKIITVNNIVCNHNEPGNDLSQPVLLGIFTGRLHHVA